MGASLIDPDYRIKYKHLFKERSTKGSVMSTLKDEIDAMLSKFNTTVDNKFYAENRVLIPGDINVLPKHGIIIEHQGKNEDFEKDFNKYKEQIEKLAKKLDNRTTIYEYSFKTEFSDRDKWLIYEGHYVAYNLSL